MKPFDLEKAKAGEPICTRDGRKARLIAHVPEVNKSYAVLCHVENEPVVWAYSEDGLMGSANYPSDEDLFMAPTKKNLLVWSLAIPLKTYHPLFNSSLQFETGIDY